MKERKKENGINKVLGRKREDRNDKKKKKKKERYREKESR